ERELAPHGSCLQQMRVHNAGLSQPARDVAEIRGIQADDAADRRSRQLVAVKRSGDVDRCAGATVCGYRLRLAAAARRLADRLLRSDRQAAAIDLQADCTFQRQPSRRAAAIRRRGIGTARSKAALASQAE